MSALEWIDRPFIVIDAWQSLGFAQSILKNFAGSWIVIYRRHEEGLKWYLLTLVEFKGRVTGKRANVRVEDALQLREHLASEVFHGKAPRESTRPIKSLALKSANRAVLLDPQTGLVKAIGTLELQPSANRGPSHPGNAPKPRRAKRAAAKKAAVTGTPRRALAGEGPIQKRRLAGTNSSETRQPSATQTNKPYTLVPVFFGTDRRPIVKKGQANFGGQRGADGVVTLGRCHVTIPASHATGELESPKWYRLEFRRNSAKHLTIFDTNVLETNDFYRELRSQVQTSSDKSAFVFVHGFNVTFEDAILRTGQIAHDVSFQGAAILFSWPSRGNVRSYMADEATIEASLRHFQQFLTGVLNRSGANVLHVLAHSMGNRALLGALEKLTDPEQQTKIHNIILAAPDVDNQVFKETAEIVHKTPKRLTLYASSRDKALLASKALHEAPRAGEAGDGLIMLPYLDTIDASNVDTDFLGHSVALADRFVLGDLFELLRRGTPPEGRFGLQKVSKPPTGFHWAFRK